MTLHGIILGGSIGNVIGGIGMLVSAYRYGSVLLLVLGAAAVVCGCYVYEAEQEVERRRQRALNRPSPTLGVSFYGPWRPRSSDEPKGA